MLELHAAWRAPRIDLRGLELELELHRPCEEQAAYSPITNQPNHCSPPIYKTRMPKAKPLELTNGLRWLWMVTSDSGHPLPPATSTPATARGPRGVPAA